MVKKKKEEVNEAVKEVAEEVVEVKKTEKKKN